MHIARGQTFLVIVSLLSVFVLASCGESSQEKAKAQVCEARSDISKQVKTLSELTLSSSAPGEAKTGLEAIGKDLTTIKDAQPDLEPARKEQVQAATHTFEAQVSSILSELVSKPSLSKLETQLKSSLTQLASELRKGAGSTQLLLAAGVRRGLALHSAGVSIRGSSGALIRSAPGPPVGQSSARPTSEEQP